MTKNIDDVDLGTEGDEEGELPLEQKYAQQMRQIFPQKIELPISTLTTMVEKQIQLNPDFQRRDVWDQKKQSKFIESLIMNVPIPPIFMGEDKYSKYVVLDGRQRLTAIVKYLKNEYELIGLKVWQELNTKRYSDLEKNELDVAITRRFLPAVLLLKESSPEVKYDVFERLNTGGLNLNPMEIRNAVYRGKFTQLLHQCADTKNFRRLWSIPDSESGRKKSATYSRMDDLELVLRFFALGAAQSDPQKERPAFKNYLNNFMKEQNDLFEKDAALENKFLQSFTNAIDNCLRLFGENAFVPEGKDKKSAPFADALMYAVSEINLDKKYTPDIPSAVQKAIKNLQTGNPSFQDAMASGTNGKAKIVTRLDEARKAVTNALKSID
jgi:uncharacterized protein with ParB-like and HNH nuclease domain